ncbi:MAG: DUF1700 domain-containing protein [Oscillospiraceae bacterium]
MTKEEFLFELREKLFGLPQDEIEERIAFYHEIINDRIEDGLTEEEAVAEMGSIDAIVEQIMAEIPLSKLVKEKVKPKRKLKTWEIVLLVLGSPVWIPLVIAVLSVVLAVYVVIWAVIICIYATNFALAVSAIAGLIGIFAYLKAGNPVGALFSFGLGVACAGLAILLFFACIGITKLMIKATNKLLLSIKISFIGKEEI